MRSRCSRAGSTRSPVPLPGLVGERKRLALVGHYSCPKVFNIQKQLIKELKRSGLAGRSTCRSTSPTPVCCARAQQRTRSFLFACLALVVTRMFERDESTFYENGVVSLNLPMAKDILGARATRTTHPKVIRGFEALFSAILERDIAIRTPFQWLTKKEVTGKIDEHGFRHLPPRPAAVPARGAGPSRRDTVGRAPNASIGGSAYSLPVLGSSNLQGATTRSAARRPQPR